MDGAVSGTEIRVYPGRYLENLVWPATGGVRLVTAAEAGTVTIDGGYAGRVITMIDVPLPAVILSGLRITRGQHPGNGAGMLIDGCTVQMSQCEIFDNNAIVDQFGNLSRPGINCIQSELTMTGCHVHDHVAIGSVGSGLTIESPGKNIFIEGCLFTNNFNRASANYGGAITHRYGTLVVRHCEFINNFAQEGAALYIANPAMMSHNLITGSRSESSSGAAVYIAHPESMFLYNTVTQNENIGIECASSHVLVRGNIVTTNSGGGIKVTAGEDIFLEHNDFWMNTGLDYFGTEAGETDIAGDPLYVDGVSGGYYLSQMAAGEGIDSPCLDAGDAEALPRGFTRTDHVDDAGIADLGFHRRSDLPGPVPTWTPYIPTSTPIPMTPTPTSGTPTMTPTFQPPPPTHTENVIIVPWEMGTIQMAIDHAENGYTILVDHGVYTGPGNVDILFHHKQIKLASLHGAANTIIDCQGSASDRHRGFTFDDGSANAVLDGFTIRNGFQAFGGGVLLLSGARPRIRNCVITGCESMSYGGGIYALYSGFTLENTVIEHCSARDGGGAISFWGNDEVTPMVYKSVIRENTCGNAENAGGVDIQFDAQPVMVSCEFINNENRAVFFNASDRAYGLEIDNCLFAGNQGGVEILFGEANIANCTFTDNSLYAVRGDFGRGIVNLLRTCFWGPEDIGIEIETADYCNIPAEPYYYKCFYSDPVFLEGPRGNYYVFQNIPQTEFSPNVNTGGIPADQVVFPRPSGIDLSLTSLTTCVTDFLDKRFADVGYHYPVTDEEPSPTPDPGPERPIIEDVLGSTEDYQANSRMRFTLMVNVSDPQGYDNIDSVQLYWENLPTPWFFDSLGDGKYQGTIEFVAGTLPAHDYEMNIAAFDREGNVCETMPYMMRIEDPPTVPGPEITGRHVWFDPVMPGEDDTGVLWILAAVQHPLGPDHIDHVELLHEDVPLGLNLLDNGRNGDIQADDSFYGMMVLYNGLQIPNSIELTLGVRVVDTEGNVSTTWPIVWRTY